MTAHDDGKTSGVARSREDDATNAPENVKTTTHETIKAAAVARLRESSKLLHALSTHNLSWAGVAPIFSECSAAFLTELVDNPAKAGLIDVIVSSERERCSGGESPARP